MYVLKRERRETLAFLYSLIKSWRDLHLDGRTHRRGKFSSFIVSFIWFFFHLLHIFFFFSFFFLCRTSSCAADPKKKSQDQLVSLIFPLLSFSFPFFFSLPPCVPFRECTVQITEAGSYCSVSHFGAHGQWQLWKKGEREREREREREDVL